MNKTTNARIINFVGKPIYSVVFSVALIILSIYSLATNGLKFGIDFTGGTLVEVHYPAGADLDKVRTMLHTSGFKDANVQYFGTQNDLLIRLEPRAISSAKLSAKIIALLGDGVRINRIEFVGPKVGEELANDGGLAMLYALIGVLIYVALRFEYRFALGSIVALMHDVIITLGMFSLLQMEFNLTVLAAILAVIGYSLNDTIVIFDRIRENFLVTRKTDSVHIVNDSINQTLIRTVITSATTLLVLLALFFLGGETIHGFATALLIGVVIGTYSSVYVASTMILLLGVSKEDLLPSKEDAKEIDQRP